MGAGHAGRTEKDWLRDPVRGELRGRCESCTKRVWLYLRRGCSWGENEWFSTWVSALSCVSMGRRFDLATACPERIEGLYWTVNGDSAEWRGCQ